MKYISLLVVACLAWSSTSSTAEAAAPFISNGAGTTAVAGSYIVVLKSNSSAEAFQPKFDAIANRQNARGGRRPRINHKFTAIPGFTVTGNRVTLTELLNSDEVEYVEQDSIVSISGSQTSPPSWGLPRVSQRQGLSNSRTSYLYANAAGAGVTAYVVDTGINTAHQDFGGRARMGANFIQGSPNTDENGHGTHVSGTIGGTSYGVAKKVQLVGVKVLGANGSGSTSGIVAALDWIASTNRGKRAVVNMSLGGGASRALNDAVTRLVNTNVPVIVAAGNDANVNACSGSPSGAQGAFTVGASDINDNVASFSSFGQCVDIFGPGVQITSAWIGSSNARNTISGTSMATPHVVGVAALYMSAHQNVRTSRQVYSALQSTASKNIIRGNLRGAANLLVFNGGGK
ncbi:subtilisin-like serine protease [Mortierella claussenii]|nr:subtilisin-like serine protease [Mortierella claussenii]